MDELTNTTLYADIKSILEVARNRVYSAAIAPPINYGANLYLTYVISSTFDHLTICRRGCCCRPATTGGRSPYNAGLFAK